MTDHTTGNRRRPSGRLKQLGKHARRARLHAPKSELILAAMRIDHDRALRGIPLWRS